MRADKPTRFMLCMALAAALAGCNKQRTSPQDPGGAPGDGTTTEVTYSLGDTAMVSELYPDASWLPAAYKSDYPELYLTIKHFTEQSLQRDGIAYESVYVAVGDTVEVTITTSDARAQAYATMHPVFLDQDHAVQGLDGVTLCLGTEGCWDPHPGNEPWAFYLPLGLPLASQRAIMLLDYPPATSLDERDYLDNFTMDRWTRILGAAGIEQPLLYETIVDTRPIAAPGSGQASYLPDPIAYFDTQASGESSRFYITPMLTLLADPPANHSSKATLPVVVLGSPARTAWGTIIDYQGQGAKVPVLAVGTVTLQDASKPTAWVAGNHPTVTTYQCCPGDPYPGCDGSFELVPDEQIDFQVACIAMLLGQDPTMNPTDAQQKCAQQWGGSFESLSPAAQHTICIQAKLDNDNPSARCASQADAAAYCDAHDNNACATYDCSL